MHPLGSFFCNLFFVTLMVCSSEFLMLPRSSNVPWDSFGGHLEMMSLQVEKNTDFHNS